jgi:DNA (cytosine-5)-methyltransferase 1
MAKPPYVIPTMREIAALPWNGLTVASTFSGCGGSCLGHRMAGSAVMWFRFGDFAGWIVER